MPPTEIWVFDGRNWAVFCPIRLTFYCDVYMRMDPSFGKSISQFDTGHRSLPFFFTVAEVSVLMSPIKLIFLESNSSSAQIHWH